MSKKYGLNTVAPIPIPIQIHFVAPIPIPIPIQIHFVAPIPIHFVG